MIFELGDSAVVMGYGNMFNRNKREPVLEGTVTARGSSCVRIQFLTKGWIWKPRLKEKWFTIEHDNYHVEKAQKY